MANPNSYISVAEITKTATEFAKHSKDFDAKKFTLLATTGLTSLSIKAKVVHVKNALLATMPASFDKAAETIERSLSTPIPFTDKGEVSWNLIDDGTTRLQGWMVWAVGDYVAEAGINHPERALKCLHALTQRFTAEFSIRPFLITHPDLTYATIAKWIKDPSPHVRRLCSEGSRPRLPWGVHLKSAINDPSPSWPIIKALQDDPSSYVRRSVANHINDIGKNHPDDVAAWVAKYRKNSSDHREALLRHACRSLVKDGHPPTLSAWNIEMGFKGKVELTLEGDIVEIGEKLSLTTKIESTSKTAKELIIDYAVHHMRANGKQTPKVFKGWKRTVSPNVPITLKKQHLFKRNQTRVLYIGDHRMDIRINGTTVAEKGFMLVEKKDGGTSYSSSTKHVVVGSKRARAESQEKGNKKAVAAAKNSGTTTSKRKN